MICDHEPEFLEVDVEWCPRCGAVRCRSDRALEPYRTPSPWRYPRVTAGWSDFSWVRLDQHSVGACVLAIAIRVPEWCADVSVSLQRLHGIYSGVGGREHFIRPTLLLPAMSVTVMASAAVGGCGEDVRKQADFLVKRLTPVQVLDHLRNMSRGEVDVYATVPGVGAIIENGLKQVRAS